MARVQGTKMFEELFSQESENGQDCIELLTMARIHKARGQEDQAAQFYAALVQVLRPETALSELKI